MLYISHRGNLNKVDEVRENTFSYIEEALIKGFNCEIDVWEIDKKWFLGHDKPIYPVNFSWFEKHKNKLLIHCKNPQVLYSLNWFNSNFHYFWHEKDRYTLTSKGIPVCYPGSCVLQGSICIKPEESFISGDLSIYGIVSDYVELYKR